MLYCTVDDIKSYISITGEGEDTTKVLNNLIIYTSKKIERYCGYNDMSVTEYTEYHDGHGSDILYPTYSPITTISGVWQDTSRQWSVSSLIDNTYYDLISNKYILLKNMYFLNYPKCIKIIYSAGYSSAPNDLKEVAIEEVIRAYKRRDRIDVNSKSTDTATIYYNNSDLLPQSKAIIESYKVRCIL